MTFFFKKKIVNYNWFLHEYVFIEVLVLLRYSYGSQYVIILFCTISECSIDKNQLMRFLFRVQNKINCLFIKDFILSMWFNFPFNMLGLCICGYDLYIITALCKIDVVTSHYKLKIKILY